MKNALRYESSTMAQLAGMFQGSMFLLIVRQDDCQYADDEVLGIYLCKIKLKISF